MARKRLASRLHLLSVREVQTAGDGDHSDGGGLILRVNGVTARWVLRYTSPTKTLVNKTTQEREPTRCEMGLGAANRSSAQAAGKSLADARQLAHDARQLVQRAVDPIDDRDARKAAKKAADEAVKVQSKREALTLLRAARDYHERVIEPSRTTKHAAQWIASVEGPKATDEDPPRPERAKLNALLPRPIGTITGPELLDAMVDLHAAVPETASRVRQRLEAIFDDAEFRGMCQGNPARAIRRKLTEAAGRRTRGSFAALDYRKAPAFLKELRSMEGIAARALEFGMLTAARTGEIIGAVWNEIDLHAHTWIVPAARMKGGEQHIVYLVPRAVAILRSMQDLNQAYVFPSPGLTGAPLSNMALLAVLRRMGAHGDTTAHGLCRATFSTWANETAAVRPDVIEACLAHREGDRIRAAYSRGSFRAARQALLLAWAEYLEGKAPVNNVIAFPQQPAAA